MSVKLISITNPVGRKYSHTDALNTAEDLISYCARVSNPSNQLNTETAPRLLKYLITHKHWSPYEMVSMCVEIKTSRAIAAQILRHRSFSFQEFSQRYSQSTSLEDIEWRLQGKTNRQVGDEDVDLSPELKQEVDNTLDSCKKLYDKLIEKGIAKECARMILPLTTSTTLYMSGTVRSFIHYLELRAKEDTQKEHRNIAEEIKKIFIKEFPVTSCALNWI
jgi:thymidylate synthase (FAD)